MFADQAASRFRIFCSLSGEVSVEAFVVVALLGLEFIPKPEQRKFTCHAAHAARSQGWYVNVYVRGLVCQCRSCISMYLIVFVYIVPLPLTF